MENSRPDETNDLSAPLEVNSPDSDHEAVSAPPVRTDSRESSPQPRTKIGRILDEDDGTFTLEYDNTVGKKHTMRLDSTTYERAIREAKSYLEIDDSNRDSQGDLWEIE